MGPLVIIELEVSVQPVMGVIWHVISGMHLFILDRSPQSFHKDIVMGLSPTIYADPDARLRQAGDR